MRCSSTSYSRLSRFIAQTFLTCALIIAASLCATAQGGGGLFVVSPGGGQNLVVDSTVNVIWFVQGAAITGTLNVDYSIDSGSTWQRIDTATARTGLDTLKWKVPNKPTTKGFVRVMMAADTTKSGRSQRFNIVLHPIPIITVTYPNGGNTFQFDSTISIRWTTQNVTGDLTVEFSIDSGAGWTMIATVPAHAGADSLLWQIPHNATTAALVRVSSSDTSDVSNRTFIIKETFNPHIAVLYPNGHEVFQAGDSVFVRWESQDITGGGGPAGQFRIEYSTDNAKTWMQIGNRPIKAGNDSLFWLVPNVSTTTALVRVGTPSGSARDTSDWVFTISPKNTAPSLQIRYPNGGEQMKANSQVYISWSAANLTGKLQVNYSGDDGATWMLLSTVNVKDGVDSLAWTVPDDLTKSALIELVSSDGVTRDTSNGTFSIVSGTASDVPEASSDAARTLQLIGSYPNPTSGATAIRWTQSRAGEVTLRMYDAAGTLVTAIQGGRFEAGPQQVDLHLELLPAGTYLYELQSGAARVSGTMTLVR